MENNKTIISVTFCKNYKQIITGDAEYSAITLEECYIGVTPIGTKTMCVVADITTTTDVEKDDITLKAYENGNLSLETKFDTFFIVRTITNLNQRSFLVAVEAEEIFPNRIYEIVIQIKGQEFFAGRIVSQ